MTSTRKLAAIMSADVFGYSRMMGEDDQVTVKSLHECKDTMRARVADHNGRVVDSPGDEMLVEFSSAVEAVKAAVEIQREFSERNSMRPENRKMRWRIGINLGDVVEEGGALYGDGVNIAARLQSLGEPGGVCISGTVFDQIDGKLPIKFEHAGEQTVKNIAKPVRVYHWTDSATSPAAPGIAKPASTARRSRVLVSIVVMVVLAAGMAWSWLNRPDTSSTATQGGFAAVLAMPNSPTVAVLPFANMSGDPTQEYFADGLTEDVITELARFKDVYVLARNTTYQFKNQAVDVPAIGRKLGAKYVLEGSVRRADGQVRIVAQLIDVQSGAHIWTERYDRPAQDIFSVQKEIADSIAASIGGANNSAIARTERKAASRKTPPQLQAYDHVLLGFMQEGWWTKEGYPQAKAHLEKAIELDPTYARAKQEYAYLMLLGWILGWEGTPAPPDTLKKNALEALLLDPSDPLSHRTAAFAYFYAHELGAFDREAKRALEMSPNDAVLLGQLGFLYAVSGQWTDGIALVTKGHKLNAEAAGGWYHAALFYDYYRQGKYREALQIILQHPNQGIVENQQKYVAVYAELGDMDSARQYWNKCLELDPKWSAKRLAEIGKLWNFPKDFWDRYMQSVAKAGYKVTP